MLRPKSALPGSRPQVELVDFGDAGVSLLAEYDSENDTIRINARAVARVRSSAGSAQAEAFVACAVAHERFHRDDPQASEAAAHEHVRRTIGGEPLRFEAYVRVATQTR